jgi:3',5'-cyclic AMP phosphodiesterase CpdA
MRSASIRRILPLFACGVFASLAGAAGACGGGSAADGGPGDDAETTGDSGDTGDCDPRTCMDSCSGPAATIYLGACIDDVCRCDRCDPVACDRYCQGRGGGGREFGDCIDDRCFCGHEDPPWDADAGDDGGDGDAAAPDDAGGEADTADDGGDPDGRRFSFALMTDLHVGDGLDDFGDPGWDDGGGDEYDVTRTLRLAVGKVNMADADYDIRFVMVTGDLGDSGERSEMLEAREILDQLDVPYFPLLGNHDMWPYTASDEAPGPVGDAIFRDVFAAHFADLATRFPSLARAPGPVWNPENRCDSHFVNYSFDYGGRHFVALDLVTRTHAPLGNPGVASDADLYDFEGGTWRWFTADLGDCGRWGTNDVFVFSHHPPIVTTLGVLDCLSPGEQDRIGSFLRDGGCGDAVFGFFAGHHHLDYDLVRYEGQHVVVTPEAKAGATVRVIQIFGDGTVDYGTLL